MGNPRTETPLYKAIVAMCDHLHTCRAGCKAANLEDGDCRDRVVCDAGLALAAEVGRLALAAEERQARAKIILYVRWERGTGEVVEGPIGPLREDVAWDERFEVWEIDEADLQATLDSNGLKLKESA